MGDRSRRRALATAALLLVAIAHTAWFRHHLTDDAFISFRYLANFLAGHGLVYNPGERVWGFTNFLWMALLAPLVASGLEPLACARALGLLSSLAVLVLVLAGLPAGRERPRRRNPAGAWLLATSGPFLLQALGGLETSFFTLLLLATLTLWLRGRALAAGVAAALATATRPEGVLLFALLCADALLERRASPAPAHRIAALWLGFAPLFAAFEAAMGSYYGALWPNPIDAKVGLSQEQLRRGLHYAAVFVRHYPVYLIVVLAAGWRFREASRDERLLLRAALLFAALPVAVGGDWMLGYRLFQPAIALAAALVPLALAGLRGEAATPRTRAAAAGLVALAGLANLAGTLRDPHVDVASRPTRVQAAVRIGRWMRAALPADAVLATNTAGSIPYHSGLRVIDMMGLNDRAIARRRELPAGWKGIEKGDGRYVLSRRPDYVQLGSFLGASVPLFLSDIELFALEEFHRRYELVRFEVDAETTLQLWRRRERERGPLDARERERIRRIAERQLALSAFRY